MNLPALKSQSLCTAVDARIDEMWKQALVREVVLKSFVLNQYEMMALGCGMILSQRQTGHLVGRMFNEIMPGDPKAARALIIRLRLSLIEIYPFWVPNVLRLAVTSPTRETCLAGLPIIEGMVIDSDHWAQLLIDCRLNPVSKTERWMNTNQMPWFLPQRFLEAGKKFWPEMDIKTVVSQLKIEGWK